MPAGWTWRLRYQLDLCETGCVSVHNYRYPAGSFFVSMLRSGWESSLSTPKASLTARFFNRHFSTLLPLPKWAGSNRVFCKGTKKLSHREPLRQKLPTLDQSAFLKRLLDSLRTFQTFWTDCKIPLCTFCFATEAWFRHAQVNKIIFPPRNPLCGGAVGDTRGAWLYRLSKVWGIPSLGVWSLPPSSSTVPYKDIFAEE